MISSVLILKSGHVGLYKASLTHPMPKIKNVVSVCLAAVFFVFWFPFSLVHAFFRRPSAIHPRQGLEDFQGLPLCDPHGPFEPSYDPSEPLSIAAAFGDPAAVGALVLAGCLPYSSKLPSVIHAACALSQPMILAELSALPKAFWLTPLAKRRVFYRRLKSKGYFHRPTDSPFTLPQVRPDFEEALLAALSHIQWSREDVSDLSSKAGLNLDVVFHGPRPPMFGKFTRLAGGGGVELLSSELIFDEIERRRSIAIERLIFDKDVAVAKGTPRAKIRI